jgi:predicted metal-dependent HD superfamily phosphohydrolase
VDLPMENILNKISEHVRNLLSTKIPPGIVYHDLMHTIEVVEAVKLIAGCYEISSDDLEILLIAAWFHDTGYISVYACHEEKSIEMAREFLSSQQYDPEKIDRVCALINATKHSIPVKTLNEQIIRDADISHIGKKGFNTKSDLLRMELVSYKNVNYSNEEWLEVNINFISKHDFFTDAAKKLFGDTRCENLAKLQKKVLKSNIKSLKAKSEEKDESHTVVNQNPNSLIRGVQTIFRVTSSNHIDLSSMADHKANIMISISSIIISAVVSFGIRNYDKNPKIMIPMTLLILVSLVSLILAILSTRPIITSGFVSREDVLKKKGNLLFFGNFHKMSLDEYVWSMQHLMNDSSYLYETLVRDIYHLGKVLGKKYHYLRMCYNVFMYGMIASVITTIIMYLIF